MAWNKRDEPSHQTEPAPMPSRPVMGAAPSTPIPSEPARRPSDRATIGPSIFIVGDLTGDEDLVIEGRVEGKVRAGQGRPSLSVAGPGPRWCATPRAAPAR